MTDEYLDDGLFDDDLFDDDLAFDQELSARLRASLADVGPSEESERRILANLLAAQADRMGEGQQESLPVVVERISLDDLPAGVSTWGAASPKRRRNARRIRRTVFAAAAFLVVVSLGLGVFFAMRGVSPDVDALKSYDATSESSADAGVDAGAAEAVPEEVLNEAPALGMAPLGVSEADEQVEAEATEEYAASSADATSDGVEAVGMDELVASGGAFDVTTDPSYDLVVGHPVILLGGGKQLRVVWHDGEPAVIDGVWVEGLVAEAQACADDDEFDVVPCWVYALPVSEDGLYVVRYVEDGSYFAARMED